MLHCCVMGSPLDMGLGPRGSRSARSEPQHAWDSFGSASHVFESPIGGGGFGSEMVSVSSMEIEAEKGVSEEGTLVNAPSQEPKPWRRGRPRKDTAKREETHLSAELSACPVVEEFVELPHLSELVGIIDRGDGSRKGRGKALGPHVESLIQQLERAKLAIAELYQENRELRHQLVEKYQGITSSQGHAGSMVWLQRWLREAQDTIVQLREAQHAVEERDIVPGMSNDLGKISYVRKT
jgi:hypothetical protein